MKKWIGIILALVMVFSLGITGWAAWEPASKEEEWENVFAEWNEDAPALNYLIEYVEAVTDESSEDYIPAEDRIDGYEEPLAFLTKEAAAALKEVSDDLIGQGYRLKIYDAYRPQMAVTNFMEWAQDPDDTRMKQYFYPELDKKHS